MTKSISYFSRNLTLSLRLISVLILFGCALCLGDRAQINHLKSLAPANPLPNLQGRAAVEKLKKEGLYDMLAEEASAARYPLTINSQLIQQATLGGSGLVISDAFGYTVAISGDTIVVGATIFDINAFPVFGFAYVFVRNGTTWSEQKILTPSDSATFDFLVQSVAISGNTVVVGAFSLDDNFNLEQEAAYVFVRNGTTWSEEQKLTASDGAAGDFFGFAVAIDGETALVGAPSDDFARGSAYVFERSGTNWSEQQKLLALDGAAFDQFGISVAINGDTLVAGANFADGSTTDQGAAYIFARTGVNWSEQQKITASDGAAFDNFGFSVTISNSTVVAGALSADIGMNTDQGGAYVFTQSGTNWSEQQKLTASDGAAGDFFGYSVAISGDTVAVTAIGADIVGNPDQGAAYIFARNGTTWTPKQKLFASDGMAFDEFGVAVAISGDTVAVGVVVSIIFFRESSISRTISGDEATVRAATAPGAVYVFAPCPVIMINPSNPILPGGTTREPYFLKFTASAGNFPHNFTVISGALPPGLNLAPDGTLSGPPNTPGIFPFTIRATDSSGCIGAMAYTLTISVSAFATISAASFTSPVTAKEIVAGFGVALANTIAFSSTVPLPTSMEGTRVMVKDSLGVERAAGLYFISPSQINYQIPADTASGAATVSVFIDQTVVAVGSLQIVTTAPSIFTLNSSGSGPAAALDAISYQPAPFNATLPDGSPNFIAVYGTGLGADVTDGGGNISASVQALIDGNPVTVTYAGQAPFLVGANQFNIRLPAGITSGEHTLRISRDGVPSNTVTIAIK